MTASAATSDAVRESLLWGGRFFFLDSGVNWLVWGMLCVRPAALWLLEPCVRLRC